MDVAMMIGAGAGGWGFGAVAATKDFVSGLEEGVDKQIAIEVQKIVNTLEDNPSEKEIRVLDVDGKKQQGGSRHHVNRTRRRHCRRPRGSLRCLRGK